MTINNVEKFMSTIWDWGILDGCFGDTKIKPTDIDGVIERNGKFLFIETKSPGASVPVGQEIMFLHLVEMDASVLVIWGEKDTPQEMYFRSQRGCRRYPNASIEELRHLVKRWFSWADKQESKRTGGKFFEFSEESRPRGRGRMADRRQ